MRGGNFLTERVSPRSLTPRKGMFEVSAALGWGWASFDTVLLFSTLLQHTPRRGGGEIRLDNKRGKGYNGGE